MNKHQHSGEKLKNWLEQNKLQEEHYGQYIAGIDPVQHTNHDNLGTYVHEKCGQVIQQVHPEVEQEKVPWWSKIKQLWNKSIIKEIK